MLADVAEMPRSALLAINWEAEEVSLPSVFLSKGTFVCEGLVEPVKVSLILALTNLSVTSRAASPIEEFLTAAAHEDSWLEPSLVPLLIYRLLCRMSLTPLSSCRCLHDRSTLIMMNREAYMMVPSSS